MHWVGKESQCQFKWELKERHLREQPGKENSIHNRWHSVRDVSGLHEIDEGSLITLNESALEGRPWVVQRLRLHTPNVGGPESILGQGTRSHMRQLRPSEVK